MCLFLISLQLILHLAQQLALELQLGCHTHLALTWCWDQNFGPDTQEVLFLLIHNSSPWGKTF